MKKIISAILAFAIVSAQLVFAEPEEKINIIFREDFTYHYISDTFAANIAAKGNLLETKNENGERYLYVERTSGDPVIDIPLNITADKFAVEGYFAYGGDSGPDRSLMLRGYNTKGVNLVSMKGSGEIYAGGAKIGSLGGGFAKITCLIDQYSQKYDVYINGALAKSGISFDNPEFDKIQIFRIYFWGNKSGKSTLKIDKLLVYEGDRLIDINDYGGYSNDYFKSDAYAIGQTEGGVAFHTASEFAIINGTRVNIGLKPVYVENELMAPKKLFDKAYRSYETNGIKKAVIGGETYYSVRDICEKSLKLNYFIDDEGYGFDKGFAIISEKDCSAFENNFMLYNEANNFLVYQRPKAAEILELFNSKSKNVHPRILADKSDFERLKKEIKTDPKKKEWAKKLIASADKIVSEAKLPSTELAGSRLDSIHQMQEPSMRLCMAYMLTSDGKYADWLYKTLETMGNRDNWNQWHFIDVGVGTTQYAVAYDWLYDYWTAEQRSYLEKTILNKSLSYALNSVHSSRYTAWLEDTVGEGKQGNWPIVCFSGPLMASLALMDVYPETAAQITEDALRGLEYTLKGYADNGDWVEGSMYWQYANKYLTYIMASLDTALGTDFGYYEVPGMKETPLYAASLIGAQGDFNFGDSEGTQKLSELSYHASKQTDGEYKNGLYALRLNIIDKTDAEYDFWDALKMPANFSARSEISLPKETYYEKIGTLTARSALNYSDETYLGCHFGSNLLSHSHFDTGGFVFDSNSVRWICDLGRDDYNINDYYNAAYRVRAEGHNVFVINPDESVGQLKDTNDRLIKKASGDGGYFAAADITSAYADHADYARRGWFLSDNMQILTVRDEIALKEKSEIYSFFHTACDVEINGNRAYLTDKGSGKRMRVDFESNQNLSLSKMAAVPLSTSPEITGSVKNNPNEGISKLVISGEAEGELYITVRFSPAESDEKEINSLPIASWSLNGKKEENLPSAELCEIRVNGNAIEDFKSDETEYYVWADNESSEPFIEAFAEGNTEVSVVKSSKSLYLITAADRDNIKNKKVYRVNICSDSSKTAESLIKNGIAIGGARLYGIDEKGRISFSKRLSNGKYYGGIFLKNMTDKQKTAYVFLSFDKNAAAKGEEVVFAPWEEKYVKLFFDMGADNFEKASFGIISAD